MGRGIIANTADPINGTEQSIASILPKIFQKAGDFSRPPSRIKPLFVPNLNRGLVKEMLCLFNSYFQ